MCAALKVSEFNQGTCHGPYVANKVALVTGGARRIGAAIVKRLSQEGAAVVFTYSRSAERAEALAAELNASSRSVLFCRRTPPTPPQ